MKKKTSFVIGFMIVILLAVSSGLMAQTTYFVDVNVVGGNHNGSSWANAFLTIQEGVNATIAGDIVLVNDGTYNTGTTVTPSYSLNNRVCITNAITVQSLNGKTVTTIEGAPGTGIYAPIGPDAVRGVYMSDGCTLEGFTITNGYTTWGADYDYEESGGGIWLTIDCVVSNCTLNGNSAMCYGGGANLYYGGMLNNCTLNNNSSNYSGGGVQLYYDGTLTNCTLISNSSPDCYGGGACLYEGGTLNNCTLSGNTADYGGGVWFEYGGILNNCLLNGNSALWGSGAYLYYGGMLNNCTLSDNTTIEEGSKGGGAFLDNNYDYDYDESILTNCILWGNTAVLDGNDIYVNNDGTILYTCASDGLVDGVNGCIADDPLFEDPGSNDYHLQVSSPCIDTGDNTYVVGAYDLDGNVRIQNGTVDMGAYEGSGSGIPSPVNVVITFNSGSVYITWDEVSEATSYKVYSSDDPYNIITEDTSGDFDGASWSASTGNVKKFYYVTAVE